jgi:glycosyltransferase 2 family protein
MGRSRRLALIQLAVSAVALGAVVWWASRQSVPPLPSAHRAIPGIVAALGLYALASMLRGERWMRLVRQGGMVCGRGDAYALTTVGYMGNNALPARAGDLLKSFLTARRAGAPQADVLGILVAERLLDVAALGLLFAGLVMTLRLPIGIPGWMLVAVGAAVLALALAAAAATRRSARGARARELARTLLAPTRRLWSRQGAVLMGTSVAVWLVEGSVYAVVGPVAGVHLSLLDGLYIMALANLVALVPAAPGYIGTFDAAVILGLGLVASASHPQQLAYVLVVRFVLFVPITLVGLVALVVRYGGLRHAWAMRARLASP